MTTVYITIGNSDNKLTQQEWAAFIMDMAAEVCSIGKIHGVWFSSPVEQWQNACWCVEFYDGTVLDAKRQAIEIGRRYRQDQIVWATAQVEMI